MELLERDGQAEENNTSLGGTTMAGILALVTIQARAKGKRAL
jgi:hypothetical protein